jgi:hypothetical protein
MGGMVTLLQADIEFKEPRHLPQRRLALEVEFPYFFNYASRVIKVSASEILVSRWQKRHKDILTEMRQCALEHLTGEIKNSTLGDYEILDLTTRNVR